jgi:hypothetical protein
MGGIGSLLNCSAIRFEMVINVKTRLLNLVPDYPTKIPEKPAKHIGLFRGLFQPGTEGEG